MILTFLVCDQSGSTSQVATLGDGVVRSLRVSLFDLLEEAVRSGGGRIVRRTGDGVIATFPSAAGAAAAAVEMQQAGDRRHRRDPAGPDIALRVGLLTAEVGADDDDVSWSDAIHAADGLCSAAGAGGVLVAATTAALLESSVSFDVVAEGGTSRLEWRPSAASPPLPAELITDDEPPLVGRDSELATLTRHWHEVTAGGRRRLVVVRGEPGIGKSRMLRELAGRTHTGGGAVLFGAASARSFGALFDAAQRYAEVASKADLRVELGTGRELLAREVPAIEQRLGGTGATQRSGSIAVDAATADVVVAIALTSFFSEVARGRPTLLVLDDLDAADDGTLDVLRRLAEPADVPLLVVGAERRPEVGRSTLERALGLDPMKSRHVVELGRLADDDVRALLAGQLGESPDPALVGAAAEADGVPYFVVQLGRIAVDRRRASRLGHTVGEVAVARRQLHDVRFEMVEEVLAAQRALEAETGPIAAPRPVVEPDGTPPTPTPRPFMGLLPFQREDSEWFAGRDRLVAEIVARLATARVVAVIGPSGSGKSSLVRAGLTRALVGQRVLGPGWRLSIVTPGNDPLAALDRALGDDVLGDPEPPPADGGQRVIVIDQFEELFTLSSTTVRDAFVERLLTAAAEHPGHCVVLVLRADFYGRLAEHPALAADVSDSQVPVGPMTDAELRRAIEEPAERAGLVLEAGLADVIVADVAGQPGALPLLSTALLETWERRRGRSMTLLGYAEAGGVRTAIARLADATYGVLDAEGQAAARRILLRMVQPVEGGTDTRRPALVSELGSEPAIEGVLHALVDRRLVVADGDRLEIAHEALLREWPLLRGWLAEDREGRTLQRDLTVSASAWDGRGRDAGELWRGARLATATAWRDTTRPSLSALEEAFLDAAADASTGELRAAQRTARRLRSLLIGVGALLVIALAAGLLALGQRARASARAVEADARGLAAQAAAARTDRLDVALLLAVEAQRRQPSLDTETGLLATLDQARRVDRFVPGLPRGRVGFDVSLDGHTAIAATGDGLVQIYDTDTWAPRGTPLAHDLEGIVFATVSGDGRRAAVVHDGKVAVWDTSNAARLDLGGEGASLVLFSPDGSRLLYDGPGILHQAAIPSGAPLPDYSFDPGSGIYGLDISPTEPRLAVTIDNEVHLVDLDTGRRVTTLKPDETDQVMPTNVAFSPDGKRLAIGSFGPTILEVDPATGKSLDTPLFASGSRNYGVRYSPDGILAAASDDNTIRVWLPDKRRNEPVVLQGFTGLGVGFGLLPDRHVVAATADQTLVWDVDQPDAIGPATPLATSKPMVDAAMARQKVATVDFDGDLRQFDSDLQEVAPPIPVGFTTIAVDLDPTASFAVAGGAEATTDGSPSNATRVAKVPLDGGEPVVVPAGDEGAVLGISLSPDGRRAAAATETGALVVVDLDTGTVETTIEHLDPMALLAAAWSPDGRHLWIGGQAADLIELDTSSWKETRRVSVGPDVAVTSIVVAGDHLLVTEETGSVHVIDIGAFEEVAAPMTSNATQLQSVAVTSDGSLVGAASRDGALRIWDAATGRPIGPPLFGHDELSRAIVGFTADDGVPSMITAGYDGRLLRWDLDPGAWAVTACRKAGRNLTRSEWDQFLPGKAYRATCPEWPADG